MNASRSRDSASRALNSWKPVASSTRAMIPTWARPRIRMLACGAMRRRSRLERRGGRTPSLSSGADGALPRPRRAEAFQPDPNYGTGTRRRVGRTTAPGLGGGGTVRLPWAGGPRPPAARRRGTGIVGQLPRVRGQTPGLPPRGVPTQVGPGVRATPLAARLRPPRGPFSLDLLALHCGKPVLERETLTRGGGRRGCPGASAPALWPRRRRITAASAPSI